MNASRISGSAMSTTGSAAATPTTTAGRHRHTSAPIPYSNAAASGGPSHISGLLGSTAAIRSMTSQPTTSATGWAMAPCFHRYSGAVIRPAASAIAISQATAFTENAVSAGCPRTRISPTPWPMWAVEIAPPNARPPSRPRSQMLSRFMILPHRGPPRRKPAQR